RVADGVAPLVTEASRQVDVADQALVHLLNGLAQRYRRAALAALLHHAVVAASCRDNLLRFIHVVRARLLDVYVLACLTGPDRLQRMVVIWSRNRHRIDRLIFQQLAEIGVGGGLLVGDFFNHRGAVLQNRFINVANGDDLRVRGGGPALDVVFAASVHADNGNSNSIVGSGRRAQFAADGSRGRGGAHKKVTPVHGSSFAR